MDMGQLGETDSAGVREQEIGKQEIREQGTGKQESREQGTGKQESREQETGKQEIREQETGKQEIRKQKISKQEIREKEIREKGKLLTSDGRLARPGYARSMCFEYNREDIRVNPFALKEWDFYQVSCGSGWILQTTIGHVSYMSSFSAVLFNIYTGERREFTRMSPLPLRSIPMPANPEIPHVIGVQGQDYRILFQTGTQVRVLTVKAQDADAGEINIQVRLKNDRQSDKLVIATPFNKENRFYLNYKENYYSAAGSISFGDRKLDLSRDASAVLDWGRGVWPFKQEWYWGNGTGWAEGKPFGFNIGWGFGDLSHATENMFFYDRKGYKLGALVVKRNVFDPMAPWNFRSVDGSFDLDFDPVFDNDTCTKLAFVDNRCHQVFGNFSGEISLPCGKRIKIENLTAFCEHAVNRW